MAARTLQPDDRIAHYRVVAPLGAGGMGEVYLAQDTTLERQVALKILPPELVRSEERVRRFVQEAKSASSLNHPNIVTIYEIGEDPVRSSSGESGTGTVRYISMELVAGKTLAAKIYDEKTDLRTLLGYLAQAAEGIAKAHAAGIVHRDLKPGNVMVSDDGFAKVLDFGLAKLTEKEAAGGDLTMTPSEAAERTLGGAIMGTAGYMSPEQAAGKTVDPRSDVFSFGCMLYEATTRARPFVADSTVETLHKILHDKPQPVEDLNPRAPAELRRLIRKCLAKSPDQRMQSMKDVAIDLREIVDEFESLSVSASSGSTIGSGGVAPDSAAPKRISRAWIVAAVAAAAAALGATAVALVGLRFGGATAADGESSKASLEMTSIATRGQVDAVSVAPDGKYVAYFAETGGLSNLFVRQISTGAEVKLLSRKQPISQLTYSPNGEQLYFLEYEAGLETASIYQLPALGGTPRKVLAGVTLSFGLSPDGQRVCFARRNAQSGESKLVVHDLDGGAEKDLASLQIPVSFQGLPAWSPDQKKIVIGVHTAENGIHSQLVTIDVESGERTAFGPTGWEIDSVAWRPDGRSLVVAGNRPPAPTPQLWSVGFPDGQPRRITNNNDMYFSSSLSHDASLLSAIRFSRLANLWAVALSGKQRPRQLTFNSSSENTVWGFDISGNDTVLFAHAEAQHTHVQAIGIDGENLRPLTAGGEDEELLKSLPDGGFIASKYEADRVPHIMVADADGGNPRLLASKNGEWFRDLTPDGKTVLFVRVNVPRELWAVAVAGGEPRRIATDADRVIGFSPDGAKVAYVTPPEIEGRSDRNIRIVPVAGGAPVAKLTLPADSDHYKWHPDGLAITYFAGHASNLYRHPLDDSEARAITHFEEGELWSQDWLRDGSAVVLNRRVADVSNLWLVSADGKTQVALTDFPTGSIFDARPAPDGKTLVFTYGSELQGAVLIRNF